VLIGEDSFSYALLLLVFGLAVCGAAFEAPRNATACRVEPGDQLAISDFDGDLRPDFARVQAGASTPHGTDYWIQLQLSAARRQSIRLVAPVGGLQIEARDVNGDHAVDLVLSSTTFGQPVAVLLNDGHGSFSRVAPSAFSEVFNNPLTHWTSACNQETEAVGVPPQSRSSVCRAEKSFASIQSRADSIATSLEGFAFDFFSVSHAGRGPPLNSPPASPLLSWSIHTVAA
jgi:hypothetical protein